MPKRPPNKAPKTDIIDALVQDVELTAEQLGEAAGAVLAKMTKTKNPAPRAPDLRPKRRSKLPR